jgi:hypothetical protein
VDAALRTRLSWCQCVRARIGIYISRR